MISTGFATLKTEICDKGYSEHGHNISVSWTGGEYDWATKSFSSSTPLRGFSLCLSMCIYMYIYTHIHIHKHLHKRLSVLINDGY